MLVNANTSAILIWGVQRVFAGNDGWAEQQRNAHLGLERPDVAGCNFSSCKICRLLKL